MDKSKKIEELEAKLIIAQEKYQKRLRGFRGVPHESASGELSYSELKVAEDHVNTIKQELAQLKGK